LTLHDLPTPAVVIDKARAIGNIERMQAAASRHGIRLRPHAKTHKSPVVAKWQIARGAVGICCAKLGEAEAFADAGIEDIRLPYPINPVSADRLVALARRARVSFIVDDLDVARGWSDALGRAGTTVDVLVKVDVGFHRCGIAPDVTTAVPFVQAVAGQRGLRLAGLLSHAGQAYHATSEDDLRSMAEHEAAALRTLGDALSKAGIAVDELSAGATPTARFAVGQPGLTEYRPGNYVYFDRTQVGLGAATLQDCALTVLARVVSRPAADRLVLDAGSKTLSSDGARGFVPTPGYGAILGPPARADGPLPDPAAGLLMERLSEEHATVRVTGSDCPLRPGDLVRILPNHACVVSNLVDQAWILEGNRVEPLPIAARGRIT
jgi:D-serine deaminase-like pyridoxal phosphate-dependent protein